MKTSILKIAPVLAIVAMVFSSCSKSCCDCTNSAVYSGEICSDDYPNPTGLVTWASYKSALEAGGCDC